MKIKHVVMTLGLAATLGLGAIVGLKSNKVNEAKAVASDYSSTIRVYVDLTWDSIDYVRIGGDQATHNAVLSNSSAQYNSDYGKYVRDITAGEYYEKMGCFFSQGGQWWKYQYDGGYVWIDYDHFAPGYEFKISGIAHVGWDGGDKTFSASVERLGKVGEAEAEEWAAGFVTGVGCSNTYNAEPSNWSTYADSYADLSIAAKSYLGTLAGSNANNATDAQKAVFMYDMAVAKYSISTFMSEYRSAGSNALKVFKNNNTNIILVTICSCSLIALGSFFLLKKKKEN